MLIVPTRLGPSAIHGLGVFIGAAVRAGTVVSRFMPPLDVEFEPELLDRLSESERAYLRWYSYRSRFTGLYVLTGDHDRYMNHSEMPNVGMNPDGSTTNLALRDIAAGEELTCDYQTFDVEWREKLGG